MGLTVLEIVLPMLAKKSLKVSAMAWGSDELELLIISESILQLVGEELMASFSRLQVFLGFFS